MAPGTRYFDADGAAEAGSSQAMGDVSMAASSQAETNGKRAFVSKRLRPQAGPSRPQTTLFVSSLPFTATSTDLTTLFSDVGPLRRAFVVTDKETGKSKGVGYVTFAVHEDAQRALEEMQAKSLDGGKRKMRIEWAVRGSADAAIGNGAEHSKPASQARAAKAMPSDKDADAVRTIVVAGLSSCAPAVDTKSLYKRTRKIGEVEKVVYPAPPSTLSPDLSDDVAHIVYRTPNHAMTAVEKLHAHTFKGAQLSVVLKKRADGVARLEAHMRPETKAKRDEIRAKLSEEQKQASADRLQKLASSKGKEQQAPVADVNRGSRLIVRNLPFDVTDRDLRAIFLPFGPIYSIDVPQKLTAADKKRQTKADTEDENDEGDVTMASEADDTTTTPAAKSSTAAPSQGRGRGFAFVWLVSRADASNAIQGVNGKELQHGAYEKAQLKVAKGKAGREAAKTALESVTASAQPARSVAVDWALSKRDFEQRKDESEAEDTAAEEESDEESDDEDAREDEDDESDRAEESDSGEEGAEDSDLDPIDVKDSDDESGTSSEEGDDAAKPSLPAPEEGTTLFIRNMPYQATEDELRNLFRSFGPLRYAKITVDKATKRPKGTAFVCYWQKESADKALQQARLVENESGTSTSGAAKKNPFSAPSVLTADPSAPLTMTLNLHGRVLSLVPALARQDADTIASASASARDKRDKRNTYLIREGVPLPGTPLAVQLKEPEIERRIANFQIRKAQMTKNPSLFMSKTRLSVRQLPLFVTDKLLKRLAAHAVKAFDEEVANGTRQGLTEDELQTSREAALASAEDDDKESKDDDVDEADMSKKQMLRKKRKDALLRRRTTNKGGLSVVQSKVVLQKDRLDAITGAGRSRGYGFLEMATFADALKVVRWANANTSLRKLFIKWYGESLETLAKTLKAQQKTEQKEDGANSSQSKLADATRLKRVEQKRQQLESGRIDSEEEGTRGGLLVVEFSVENIVVVKRRAERGEVIAKRKARKERDAAAANQGSGDSASGSKRKRGRSDEYEDSKRSMKKSRPATWNQKTPKRSKATGAASAVGANALPLGSAQRHAQTGKRQSDDAEAKSPKEGTKIGSLIGRKRKQRKGKA